MFVHVKCGELLLRRPISICDADGDCLRLVIDRRGDGTKWLTERKKFDVIDILGPLGRGFDLSGGRLLAVGGGIGAPPMLYAAKRAKSADCVLGFRSAENVILLKDFGGVCGEVGIATDDGSLGYKGYVSGLVKLRLEKGSFDRVLACGPTAMLKSVWEVCREYGAPLQVSLEERMGCGVGACLVCACKTASRTGEERYSHVCKDGPVFDAGEVVWQ
jgi:dihydroorotate dehydrogenase electron transfer subunit